MQLESPAPKRRSLSLTPLIDVVFILLVFFMLVSSFVEWQSVTVDTPPPVTAGAAVTDQPALRLQVYEDGRLRLDGESVSLVQAAERASASPEAVVHIVPQGELALQRLVTVLDRLAAAGVKTRLIER